MSAMTALPVRHDGWTVDDLDDLPEDGRFELVDGGLLLSPAPALRHGYALLELAVVLRAAAPVGYCVLVETGLHFDPRNLRQPDVLVVRRAALVEKYAAPSDVLLAIEVMSPGSVSNDRVTKPAQYAAAGIAAFWRLELDERVLITHVLDAGGYRETGRHTAAAVVQEPFPVRLHVPDLLV